MNDPEQSSVQLFWSVQGIILHIEIHSTLQQKWIILKRVVFNDSDEFMNLSQTLRFITYCIRNQWLWAEFCLTFLMVLWQYSIYREMWEIEWKINEYKKR